MSLLVLGASLFFGHLIVTQNYQTSIPTLGDDPIVNIHESVEDEGDVAKLLAAMSDNGIDTTVLTGIPGDLLRYTGGRVQYHDLQQNHDVILNAIQEHPENFTYVCAIDAGSTQRMAALEKCMKEGAVGFKFYQGYSYAHDVALDYPKLHELYERASEENLIAYLPTNMGMYESELKNVLELHPDLNVVCPHYCLMSKRLDKLATLLDTYDNLYIDTSFGSTDFAKAGFERIRSNATEFQEFFKNYDDRILFATDTVVTGYEGKDRYWLNALFNEYMSLLTEELDLPKSVQRKIFWQNWYHLLR